MNSRVSGDIAARVTAHVTGPASRVVGAFGPAREVAARVAAAGACGRRATGAAAAVIQRSSGPARAVVAGR